MAGAATTIKGIVADHSFEMVVDAGEEAAQVRIKISFDGDVTSEDTAPSDWGGAERGYQLVGGISPVADSDVAVFWAVAATGSTPAVRSTDGLVYVPQQVASIGDHTVYASEVPRVLSGPTDGVGGPTATALGPADNDVTLCSKVTR